MLDALKKDKIHENLERFSHFMLHEKLYLNTLLRSRPFGVAALWYL